MRTLKKAVILGGVVVALSCLFLGTDKVASHLRAARQRAQEGVDELSSDVQEAARIRVMLADFDQQILANQDVVADLAAEAEKAERAVAGYQEQRAREVGFMRQAKALLDHGRDSYTIGSKAYSRAEVTADAGHRLERCKEIDEELTTQQRVREQATLRAKEGEALILKARTERQRAEAELNRLLLRIQNARLLGRLNELTAKFQATSGSSELGTALASFRARAEKLDRRNAYYGATAKEGGTVAWEAAGAGDEHVRTAVGDYLKAHPEGEPAARAEGRAEVQPPHDGETDAAAIR